VFEVDGTLEACNKMLESLEKIDNTKMEEFYGKISNIRMMPAFIRRKVMSAKHAVTQGSWEKLQQVCALFNIIIYAEVRNE
jgi:transcription elongation factor GreA-like protein